MIIFMIIVRSKLILIIIIATNAAGHLRRRTFTYATHVLIAAEKVDSTFAGVGWI